MRKVLTTKLSIISSPACLPACLRDSLLRAIFTVTDGLESLCNHFGMSSP